MIEIKAINFNDKEETLKKLLTKLREINLIYNYDYSSKNLKIEIKSSNIKVKELIIIMDKIRKCFKETHIKISE